MSCGNLDILKLIDYFENGADLSSYSFQNYNFYDLWNAAENGEAPPERIVCSTLSMPDILSVTKAILGDFTTSSEYLGKNLDFYYLYLKAIGNDDPSPVFTNKCIYDLYQVFNVGSYTPDDDDQLFGWWNAQSGMSTSGDPLEVGMWISTNGNLANPPTVTSRPLYGSDQINGLDVLTFRSSDPNYLHIQSSPQQSGLCLSFVIDITNTSAVPLGISGESGYYIRYLSGNTADADNNGNLGGSIEYYINGISIGNDITRGELYTGLNNGAVVVSFDGLNTSSSGDIMIGARNVAALGVNGTIADIILSTGNANLFENVTYLMDKYGIS